MIPYRTLSGKNLSGLEDAAVSQVTAVYRFLLFTVRDSN